MNRNLPTKIYAAYVRRVDRSILSRAVRQIASRLID